MHTREIVFEPLDAHLQREQGNEPVLLRAKQELDRSDPGWYSIHLAVPQLIG
jgi:mediator of RNA polymerase II transcription subunit 18